jgi:carboxymethylenebutenolidase
MSYLAQLTSEDGHNFSAYVAEPIQNPIGGLVLLQEIFGVNSHIRSVADAYADAGYFVVAPAMFDRVERNVELGYESADMQKGVALKAAVEALPLEKVMQDVAAAVDLAAQGGKVGVMGFCWGGLLTWRAACLLPGLTAAVSYYGGGMTKGDEVQRQPKVPVLAHFADQDTHIDLPSVAAFAAAQPSVEVMIHAGQHGFNCDQRGSYNAHAAAQARERSLAFFAQHLAI